MNNLIGDKIFEALGYLFILYLALKVVITVVKNKNWNKALYLFPAYQ
jgi:hypothetical protein